MATRDIFHEYLCIHLSLFVRLGIFSDWLVYILFSVDLADILIQNFGWSGAKLFYYFFFSILWNRWSLNSHNPTWLTPEMPKGQELTCYFNRVGIFIYWAAITQKKCHSIHPLIWWCCSCRMAVHQSIYSQHSSVYGEVPDFIGILSHKTEIQAANTKYTSSSVFREKKMSSILWQYPVKDNNANLKTLYHFIHKIHRKQAIFCYNLHKICCDLEN